VDTVAIAIAVFWLCIGMFIGSGIGYHNALKERDDKK
jgi:ABC-type dipeptide/oligopeptide/nickel transport system permease subunit